MGGCRCSYKSCKSATKTTENLHFFHYPVKDKDRCAVWIKNADKPQFATLPTDQLRNKVVCGLHFLDKYFANVQKRRLVHNAIPTLDIGCDSIPDDLSYVKEVEILPTSSDGTTFTLHAEHLQPGPSTKLDKKLDFQNGTVVLPVDDTQNDNEVYTIDPSYIKQTVFDLNSSSVRELVTSHETDSQGVGSELEPNEEDCMMIYDSGEPKYEITTAPTSITTLNNSFNSKPARVVKYEIQEHQNENQFELQNPTPAKRAKCLIVESGRKELTPKGNNNITVKTPLVITKETLKRNNLPTSIRLSNKCIIKSLKGKVPDSVLGLLSLHLYKRNTVLTNEEEAFATLVADLPPVSRNLLKQRGWNVPI